MTVNFPPSFAARKWILSPALTLSSSGRDEQGTREFDHHFSSFAKLMEAAHCLCVPCAPPLAGAGAAAPEATTLILPTMPAW